MIYYNDKIMTVDFKVFENKTYKFFIDDKLCEIHVVQQRNGSFGYEFKFDYKTETPHNIERKKREQRWTIQGIGAIFGGIGVLIAFISVFWFFRGVFLDRQLQNNGVDGWASIRVIDRYNYKEVYYHFENAEGEIYNSKPLPNNECLTPEGLPLADGDVFKIKYAASNIFNHRLDYTQPNQETLKKIIKRIADFHVQHHQGRMFAELLCEVQASYELRGIDGLLDVYNQLKPASKSENFNEESFSRLIHNDTFQLVVQGCIQ